MPISPVTPFYFPPESGRYEVAAGLKPLGTDFGNGPDDRRVFQVDRRFHEHYETKLAARSERLNKYYLTSRFEPHVAATVARLIVERLRLDHGDLFAWRDDSSRGGELRCALTGHRLVFDESMRLIDAEHGPQVDPTFIDAFDALAMQLTEDVAVMRRDEHGGHWLSALHLCQPNHWSGADKIGRRFEAIHEPVPGIEAINRKADSMVAAMVRAERGLARFAWGLATDRRLNHHPEPPPGIAPTAWHGRTFDPIAGELWLRVERQAIMGLPAVDAALFVIRTLFVDVAELRRTNRRRCGLLRSAVAGMTPKSLEYKGIAAYRDDLLRWLDEGCASEAACDR